MPRHYPKWPLLWIALVAASMVPVWLVSLWFLFLLVLMLLGPVAWCIHVRERFVYGDANVGVVVQVEPTLVAVLTDLSKGFGSYPAVRIVRARLRRIGDKPVRVGMRLPTVAVYRGLPHSESSHWCDFDPKPLECATADRKMLARVMASFTDEDGERLEAMVRELPSIRPGLYRLTEDGWRQVEGFSFRAVARARRSADFAARCDRPTPACGPSYRGSTACATR